MARLNMSKLASKPTPAAVAAPAVTAPQPSASQPTPEEIAAAEATAAEAKRQREEYDAELARQREEQRQVLLKAKDFCMVISEVGAKEVEEKSYDERVPIIGALLYAGVYSRTMFDSAQNKASGFSEEEFVAAARQAWQDIVGLFPEALQAVGALPKESDGPTDARNAFEDDKPKKVTENDGVEPEVGDVGPF